ncbi:hypothetical protein F2Q70_00027038 [Brassica cretica]|uniref:Uncharacterized protein n=1 Tax=Brassica cretica TaxID=69181 RepID=A0A8S9LAY9_BRACR|nr:hypothetical protein F2Q70_00027038 [Brassica cretica]
MLDHDNGGNQSRLDHRSRDRDDRKSRGMPWRGVERCFCPRISSFVGVGFGFVGGLIRLGLVATDGMWFDNVIRLFYCPGLLFLSKWSGLSVLSCEEAFGLLSVNGLDRIVVSAFSGFSCYRPFLLFKLERFLVEFEQIFPLIWFLLAALVHPISGANLFFKLLVLCAWPMARI